MGKQKLQGKENTYAIFPIQSQTIQKGKKKKKSIKETNKNKYQMREDRDFRKKVILATAVLGLFPCHMVLNHNKLSFILHLATC